MKLPNPLKGSPFPGDLKNSKQTNIKITLLVRLIQLQQPPGLWYSSCSWLREQEPAEEYVRGLVGGQWALLKVNILRTSVSLTLPDFKIKEE